MTNNYRYIFHEYIQRKRYVVKMDWNPLARSYDGNLCELKNPCPSSTWVPWITNSQLVLHSLIEGVDRALNFVRRVETPETCPKTQDLVQNRKFSRGKYVLMLRDEQRLYVCPWRASWLLESIYQLLNFSSLPLAFRIGPENALDACRMHVWDASITWTGKGSNSLPWRRPHGSSILDILFFLAKPKFVM